MQRDFNDLDSASTDLFKDLRSEVKSGSRRRCRSAISREYSLIALAIGGFIVAAYIRRKRNVANVLNSFEKIGHRCETQAPLAVLSTTDDFGFEDWLAVSIAKAQHLSDAELAARPNKRFPLAVS